MVICTLLQTDICLKQGADLHVAQLMPLPLTVSCSSKIQISFTFLVLADLGVCVCVCVCVAYLGSPGQRVVKWLYDVCVCVCVS